jgi:hypothetical protein
MANLDDLGRHSQQGPVFPREALSPKIFPEPSASRFTVDAR